MPTTKKKIKRHLHFHLTVRIKNTYVYVCHIRSYKRRKSHFIDALSFINANCTLSTYFYISGARKMLDGMRICPVFTKNNMTVVKMNNFQA